MATDHHRAINHSFISFYSRYQSSSFISSLIILAPVISSLDEIYCTFIGKDSSFISQMKYFHLFCSTLWFFSRVIRDSTFHFDRPSIGLSICQSVSPLVCWSVTPLVRWFIVLSVRHYFFYVFAVFGFTTPAQILCWPQIFLLPTFTWLG